MLQKEARWLGAALTKRDVADLSPMLNAGSHTKEFRTRVQPWIDKHVFAPLEARGVDVQYADIRPGAGVDHVGDLTDPEFVATLRRLGFRSVLCSNLLEHVPDPHLLARSLVEVVSPGGLVIYSGPNRFPYHADPIDNMFRPGPDALAEVFPGTTVQQADEVGCGTFATYLAGRVAASPVRVVRDTLTKSRATNRSAPAADQQPVAFSTEGDRPDGKSPISRLLPWLVRRFTVTCAVLRTEH